MGLVSEIVPDDGVAAALRRVPTKAATHSTVAAIRTIAVLGVNRLE
jgi:hypothetical protein